MLATTTILTLLCYNQDSVAKLYKPNSRLDIKNFLLSSCNKYLERTIVLCIAV